MKYSILIAFSIISVSTFVQESPLTVNRNTEFNSGYNNFNNKKETLLEKQIFNIGKIKNLNFQKIILKDSKDNPNLKNSGYMKNKIDDLRTKIDTEDYEYKAYRDWETDRKSVV